MRAKDILVGPLGLRSGWRLLIFLAIVIALQAAFQEVVGRSCFWSRTRSLFLPS